MAPSAQNAPTPWSVYILRCADGTLYTGATNGLARRLEAHSTGRGARYTRSRTPVKLLFHEVVGTKGQALSREWALKALTRTEKLALIRAAAKTARALPKTATLKRPARSLKAKTASSAGSPRGRGGGATTRR